MNEYEEAFRRLLDDAKGKPRLRRFVQSGIPTTRVRYADTEFLITPPDNYTEFILWRRGRPPEDDATQALATRFRDQPAVIVDVGANAGIFALPILKAAGAGARYLGVEPNPEMVARLRGNLALNRFAAADVAEVAVSDQAGSARLHFSDKPDFGAARLGEAQGEAGGIDVDVETLPDILGRHGISTVDLLKVDVEGHEDRVIVPALEAGIDIRAVYFEDEHKAAWTHDLVAALETAGLTETRRFGPNAFYARVES